MNCDKGASTMHNNPPSDSEQTSRSSYFSNLPPAIQAAILLGIPIAVVDFLSAGKMISVPLLIMLYVFCGWLAARFDRQDDSSAFMPSTEGAKSGAILWAVSMFGKILLSLVFGLPTTGFISKLVKVYCPIRFEKKGSAN